MMNREKNVITAVFQRLIEHKEQSTYIEVPFEMPERVENLHIMYEVESHGEGKAVIDLGVRDGRRLRGWSGGARSEFVIGLEQATPGYIPGELAPGSWAVVHNAYKVPKEGCTVTVTATFQLMAPRWLKGDLHTHSVHSDGTHTLEENAAIMEELGCDFIAMTDHNAVSQNLMYPRNKNVVMIPGMEFTTNFGHSNFLGVADPCDDFRVANEGDVHERIRMARERGAKIVLNHPHCDWCPWEWTFQVDHDWVEVWNGPFTERNVRACQWWHEQLVAGRKLVAVGGSDVHRPDPFVKHAMPCTWVLAETKTAAGILNGIGQGRVFITYSPEGPFMELTCGVYMMGDTVLASAESTPVKLHVEHLQAGDQVKLISNLGVEREIKVTNESTLDIEADSANRLFYRAEVWRRFASADQPLLAGLTNPIYIR
ncbi:CehA/McbA family metallohydrolase [Paenibacillus aestuarii]|uniref:CehA/McbA family metallohydrolase n=1 Tax=Paenibacillus aestuarii TaxID=516965 RepID=A0ABW0KAI7_9BACL|nr:CehA/McbA family metallohydrolase [Paenibacillus aestuarii]